VLAGDGWVVSRAASAEAAFEMGHSVLRRDAGRRGWLCGAATL
jgi:hypothetical protein